MSTDRSWHQHPITIPPRERPAPVDAQGRPWLATAPREGWLKTYMAHQPLTSVEDDKKTRSVVAS